MVDQQIGEMFNLLCTFACAWAVGEIFSATIAYIIREMTWEEYIEFLMSVFGAWWWAILWCIPGFSNLVVALWLLGKKKLDEIDPDIPAEALTDSLSSKSTESVVEKVNFNFDYGFSTNNNSYYNKKYNFDYLKVEDDSFEAIDLDAIDAIINADSNTNINTELAFFSSHEVNSSNEFLNSILDANRYFDILSCDVAEPWQFGTQDPATPIMEGMIYFNNYLIFFLIFIGYVVMWLLAHVMSAFDQKVQSSSKPFNHASVLEFIWTIIPAVLLIYIAVPSFSLLYSIDELIKPDMTIKVIGHQWYWSYEYSDQCLTGDTDTSISFDSYILEPKEVRVSKEEGKRPCYFRLLNVDNNLVIPASTHIRLLITSADVLHSWCVPSFGIKLDACPGRLSQTSLFVKREGLFFGQCSEICGVNHGFMPIAVEVISRNVFKDSLAIVSLRDLIEEYESQVNGQRLDLTSLM